MSTEENRAFVHRIFEEKAPTFRRFDKVEAFGNLKLFIKEEQNNE